MQDTESAETLGSSMEDPSLVVNINKQHHKDQVREATRGPRITRNMMLPPPCITCILHPHRTACHKLFIPSAPPLAATSTQSFFPPWLPASYEPFHNWLIFSLPLESATNTSSSFDFLCPLSSKPRKSLHPAPWLSDTLSSNQSKEPVWRAKLVTSYILVSVIAIFLIFYAKLKFRVFGMTMSNYDLLFSIILRFAVFNSVCSEVIGHMY